MKRYKELISITSSLLLFILLSSCQVAGIPAVTAMHVANVADQHAVGKRAERLWELQRENVRRLQAQGDSMGDYLYALGNAQGWLSDTSDPTAIRDLLEKATKEGSSDAKIVLGIYYFSGSIPVQFFRPQAIWLPNSLRNRELGIALIRDGMKVRCTYAEPFVDAYGNRDGIRYISAASWIWPKYRDGDYIKSASGQYIQILEKDPVLERKWHDLDAQCRASGATSE